MIKKECLEIKKANACYSGGGIYLYYGIIEYKGSKFSFLTSSESESVQLFYGFDDWENLDLLTDCDYQEENLFEEITGNDATELYTQVIDWILENKPNGNYLVDELIETKLPTDADNRQLENLSVRLDKVYQDYDLYEYRNADGSLEKTKSELKNYPLSVVEFLLDVVESYQQDIEDLRKESKKGNFTETDLHFLSTACLKSIESEQTALKFTSCLSAIESIENEMSIYRNLNDKVCKMRNY